MALTFDAGWDDHVDDEHGPASTAGKPRFSQHFVSQFSHNDRPYQRIAQKVFAVQIMDVFNDNSGRMMYRFYGNFDPHTTGYEGGKELKGVQLICRGNDKQDGYVCETMYPKGFKK